MYDRWLGPPDGVSATGGRGSIPRGGMAAAPSLRELPSSSSTSPGRRSLMGGVPAPVSPAILAAFDLACVGSFAAWALFSLKGVTTLLAVAVVAKVRRLLTGVRSPCPPGEHCWVSCCRIGRRGGSIVCIRVHTIPLEVWDAWEPLDYVRNVFCNAKQANSPMCEKNRESLEKTGKVSCSPPTPSRLSWKM